MITNRVYSMFDGDPWLQGQLKRVLLRLPHRERVITRFGYKLVVDPSELHGFHLYYQREYDDYIFRFLLPRLKTFERAFDIGANIGIYTIFLAQHVPRLDAFEPEPLVVPRLRRNLELNGLSNVTIHECCIGMNRADVPFVRSDRRNQGVGRIAVEQLDGWSRPCISLDQFLGRSITESCLIKIDIEGAELLAIRGAQQALANRSAPVCLLIEVHPEEVATLGGSLDELNSLLSSLSLRVHGLTPEGLVPLRGLRECRFWWAES